MGHQMTDTTANEGAWLPEPLAPPADRADGLRFLPFTDAGNGERLALRFRDEIRYCRPQKVWYINRGRRWELDETGEMLQRAKMIARTLYGEAAHFEDEKLR